MNTDIVQGLVFLAITVVSYLVWKKYKNKDYMWFGLIGIAGALLNTWDYSIEKFFHISLEIKIVNTIISIIVWVIFILLVLKIAIWGSKNSNRDNGDSQDNER